MADTNTAFTGSIPEQYDRFLGPMIFAPYAEDLVARLALPDSASVLEIACGTGILTRLLRDRLPGEAKLTATDLNPDMMEVAGRKFGEEEAVAWQQADATRLPFADESFDAVICQFGLMFFPDKRAAVGEAWRVLRAGGVFTFNVWDAMEKNEEAKIVHEVVASFFANDPPTFYEIPFGFHDPEVIGALLREAGFVDVRVTAVAKTGESPTARDAARGLVEGNPISGAIRERGKDTEEIIAAVAAALASRFSDHPFRCPLQALVFSAIKGNS